jgi:hypothetical protein
MRNSCWRIWHLHIGSDAKLTEADGLKFLDANTLHFLKLYSIKGGFFAKTTN